MLRPRKMPRESGRSGSTDFFNLPAPMPDRPDVSIIIVNWNSKALVQQCVSSIFVQPPEHPFEIIVIDNASFDGCAAMLAAQFPSVRFIQSEKNLGFGKANNVAAAQSRSEALLFLNPDTEVIGDAIDRMLEQSHAPKCGAIGATLLNTDGSIQTSALLAYPTLLNQLLDCDLLRKRFPHSRLWANAPLFSNQPAPSRVEAISGACLMMRRQVFEEVGGFSAEYFMYSEDTDLCFKAHLRGYRNYYVPQACVTHHGDGSVRKARSSFAVVMAAESLWRFMAKHRGITYAALYRVAVSLMAIGRVGLLSLARLANFFRLSDQRLTNSLPKWNTILRWSLMRETWVLKY